MLIYLECCFDSVLMFEKGFSKNQRAKWLGSWWINFCHHDLLLDAGCRRDTGEKMSIFLEMRAVSLLGIPEMKVFKQLSNKIVKCSLLYVTLCTLRLPTGR